MPKPPTASTPRVYDGDMTTMLDGAAAADHITIVPDTEPSTLPDTTPRIRIQWGQHLMDDLVAGRYRSLICAVNAEDNSHGLIAHLADQLPTSQWDNRTITEHATRHAREGKVTILKIDLDTIEVLALLRPVGQDALYLADLHEGMRMIAEMVKRKPQSRRPVASVSFLGSKANKLTDRSTGEEPSLETVLRTMHDAGFAGDVYPPPALWQNAPDAVYARYPFPDSIDQMRQGGF
ncbi:hypothetical protein OT109_01970 [Phycisphaeraceae bacterium D3-23]